MTKTTLLSINTPSIDTLSINNSGPTKNHSMSSDDLLQSQPADQASLMTKQQELITRLKQQINTRHEREDRIAHEYNTAIAKENEFFGEQTRNLNSQINEETAALAQWQDQSLRELNTWYADEQQRIQSELRRVTSRAESDYRAITETADKECNDTVWMVNSYFEEAGKDGPRSRYESFAAIQDSTKTQLQSNVDNLEHTVAEAESLLRKQRMLNEIDDLESLDESLLDIQRPDNEKEQDEVYEFFSSLYKSSQNSLEQLKKLKLTRIFRGWNPVLFFLCTSLGAAGCAWLIQTSFDLPFNLKPDQWNLVIAGSGLIIGLVVMTTLYAMAGSRSNRWYEKLILSSHMAQRVKQHWLKLSNAERKRLKEESETWYPQMIAKRDSALQNAESKRDSLREATLQKRNKLVQQAEEQHSREMTATDVAKDSRLNEIEAVAQKTRDDIAEKVNNGQAILNSEHENRLAQFSQKRQTDWNTMAGDWKTAIEDFHSAVQSMQAEVKRYYSPWQELINDGFPKENVVPPFVPIGHHVLDLDKVINGISNDPALKPSHTRFELPYVLSFPHSLSLLVRAYSEGRKQATDLLQLAMLRLFAYFPPGKIRFTILDPVGLGENFSTFMHLADYDELLINSRIWTKPTHIEQKLANLTEHLENVLQTYLRNEFESIQEYNEFAGEVAEPYQILIVADFPTNFSEEAARRLASIVQSGPRCGVYTLMSMDTRLSLPHQFSASSLDENMVPLKWDADCYSSNSPELQELPLVLDKLPAPELFGSIVRLAGERSKNARKVEVPFQRIAPSNENIWTKDSRSGIDIPLGRAGATKLQYMRLGHGTSQHVLIAGKTGSGKSTLLHILITNAALHYSPDEIEFYLIDFKKGVEFKTYANHHLPHARVIGIESDREFGLSALERLDQELKQRGDLFRNEGVQDIESFRNARPETRMPRVLLIIDEFQEFFVDDDRLSQAASLLLDRLVRQGRAFGIHVMLGSQTLGGAYSLARSTLGQMAVRVALQCSESDAHLILSEENPAARLLTRPGEAIYNDANGMVEGNHPFQIAWLDEDVRESSLAKMRDLQKQNESPSPNTVVFEGNIPANPQHNPGLVQAIQQFESGKNWDNRPNHLSPSTWIGESVAIASPPEISFPQQSGSHLLVVGQSADAALGVMSTILVGVAAQYPVAKLNNAKLNEATLNSVVTENGEPTTPSSQRATSQFYLLVGNPPDSPEQTKWNKLKETIPHQSKLVKPTEEKSVIAELVHEIEYRDQHNQDQHHPIFVMIYNLGQFRDLRKSDDDFGFGGYGEEKTVSVSKQFGDVVSKGASLGIHFVVWSDTYNNLNRWLSPQTLREFERRILFRMSPADSSNLIDSPAAGKLGVHRGLLHLEDVGKLIKFRPFGPPTADWLGFVRSAFQPGQTDNSSVEIDEQARILDSWEIL